MDATLDSEDIALLNQLSDKQKDYALTFSGSSASVSSEKSGGSWTSSACPAW